MRKHIKRLHFQRIGNKFICYLNSELNGTTHNYNIEIYKSNFGNYGLAIYLALTKHDAKDILVYRGNYDTFYETEKDAINIILELEHSNLNEEIKEWKYYNVKPVFNENFELIGDIYSDFSTLKEDKSYDYYNDNPIKSFYGKFYTLDNGEYNVINSSLNKVSVKSYRDKRVLNKMLNKIKNNKKYERFFTKV